MHVTQIQNSVQKWFTGWECLNVQQVCIQLVSSKKVFCSHVFFFFFNSGDTAAVCDHVENRAPIVVSVGVHDSLLSCITSINNTPSCCCLSCKLFHTRTHTCVTQLFDYYFFRALHDGWCCSNPQAVKSKYAYLYIAGSADPEGDYQLDVDVSGLIFSHHPLFSREHVLGARLAQLYDQYLTRQHNNLTGHLTDKVSYSRWLSLHRIVKHSWIHNKMKYK